MKEGVVLHGRSKAEEIARILIDELERNESAAQRDIGHEIHFANEGHPFRSISDNPEIFFTLLEQRIRDLMGLNTVEGDEKARRIAENAYWRVFSGSPNLFNDLGLLGMIFWSAKVRRIPVLERCLSSTVIGEMVYEFAYVHDPQATADRIVARLKKEKIPTILDLIDQLSDVRALAEYEDYAERAYALTEYILETVRHTFPQVVVQEACVLALGGDIVASRTLSWGEKVAAKLAKRIHPDRKIDVRGMVRFAPDVVAYIDKRGVPQYLASTGKKVFQPSSKEVVQVHVEPITSVVTRELQGRQGLTDAESAIGILQYLHRPEWSAWMREVLGRPLSELHLREQICFALHLLHADAEQMYDLQGLVHSYGSAAMRTFLSMEQDPGMGDKILEFASSSVSEEEKRWIFEIYGGIIDMAQEDGANAEVTEMIEKAARDVLVRAHEFKDEPERLQRMLQKISIKGQALVGIFRESKARGKARSLEDIEGVTYEVLEGSRVLADKRLYPELIQLYWKNHRQYPRSAAHRIKNFEENLDKEGALLHLITFKKKVIGFLLVAPIGERRLYVSALNVDEELVGVHAGPMLAEKMLAFVREGNTLEVRAEGELTRQYELLYGFKKIDSQPTPNVDGIPIFRLELGPPSRGRSSTAPRTKSDARNRSKGR